LSIQTLTRCAAIALVALGLGGCGRRGSLETPPGAATTQAPASPNAIGGGLDGAKAQKPQGISPPNEPFILDPLL
jgi:predicted small lipoprotein YifL